MIGKNNVQKRAARSRVRLLRLATVRPNKCLHLRLLVAQRSTGQVEEYVFESGLADTQVVRLHAHAVGESQQSADSAGHFTRARARSGRPRPRLALPHRACPAAAARKLEGSWSKTDRPLS